MSTTYHRDGTERASLLCRLGWHRWRRLPILGPAHGLTWAVHCARCDVPRGAR